MHIFNFLLFYPIFMSIYWIVGSIYYFFIKEKPFNRLLLVKSEHQQVEGISFLLACYNESETVQDTLSSVLSLEYPEKEIIIINDGSSDNTAEIIYEFKKNHDFKFVDLEVNRGKANALNEGIKQASYEYVMCLDADTVIDDDAPFYMIEDFKKNPKLGA
ncbi:poly-beta-1,6 N-acetyl-D-glucosamine synthase, partial [Staphylococcus epidermidis]